MIGFAESFVGVMTTYFTFRRFQLKVMCTRPSAGISAALDGPPGSIAEPAPDSKIEKSGLAKQTHLLFEHARR
jgi:hypothetical protein